MIVLSHPTGNVFVRSLLAAFEREKFDFRFFTTLAFQPSHRLFRLLPAMVRSEMRRRSFTVTSARCRQRPGREIGRLISGQCGLHFLTRGENAIFSVDAVYRDLDRWVAGELSFMATTKKIRAVYAYEDGALETFTAAKSHGIKCYYEIPIAYWQTSRRLLEEEAERWPEWEPTLIGTRDSIKKLERKTMELSLADTVVCPSQFVHRSLPQDVRRNKVCLVAEFGSPTISTAKIKTERTGSNLRVLFAGSMSQRKGLADVFAAMKILRRADIELVIMGSPTVPMEFYREQYPHFHYEPPRPHGAVMELMQTCDVLVLPSIVEGRALVQQEAMSCGLPIIVTANAGGEDLVEEGETGFLVPIRSPEAIAEKIAWFADHRDRLGKMSRAAQRKAGDYTWVAYGEKILSALGPVIATERLCSSTGT